MSRTNQLIVVDKISIDNKTKYSYYLKFTLLLQEYMQKFAFLIIYFISSAKLTGDLLSTVAIAGTGAAAR